jgi:hypothetical protein
MKQVRILLITGVAALAYSAVLLFRGGPDVQMTVAGMEGSVFPRVGVFVFVLIACVFQEDCSRRNRIHFDDLTDEMAHHVVVMPLDCSKSMGGEELWEACGAFEFYDGRGRCFAEKKVILGLQPFMECGNPIWNRLPLQPAYCGNSRVRVIEIRKLGVEFFEAGHLSV